ncbi:MAG: TlyA family RNA methyltransferase [Myxococcaceae bacterium]
MKAKRERADVLLHARGLADSRAKAQALILAGDVTVMDAGVERRVEKAGQLLPADAELRLASAGLPYVSRGGLKLKHALEAWQIRPEGIWADIGASTGGFTDCLLQAGAARVYAIDVGYGQLHEKIRQDERVHAHERINARYLTPEVLPEPLDGAVMDVSFISATQVLPAVMPFLKPAAWVVVLVKPQFEAGREYVEKGGVVRNEAARSAAAKRVSDKVEALGGVLVGLTDSPILGPAGNREILLAARVGPSRAHTEA